jgi:hypothetical protein
MQLRRQMLPVPRAGCAASHVMSLRCLLLLPILLRVPNASFRPIPTAFAVALGAASDIVTTWVATAWWHASNAVRQLWRTPFATACVVAASTKTIADVVFDRSPLYLQLLS